jgi:sugar transferase (PEP-CTERM system associated)
MSSATPGSLRGSASARPRLGAMASGRTLFLLDLIATLFAFPLALWAGEKAGFISAPRTFVLFLPANTLLLFAMGLYRRDTMLQMRQAFARLPLVTFMGALLASGCNLALTPLFGWPLPRPIEWGAVGAHGMLAVLLFTSTGIIARLVFRLLQRSGVMRRRLLVVGAGARAWDLLHMLRRESTRLDDDIVALHDPALGQLDPRLESDPQVQVIQGVSVLQAARGVDADQIVVAPDERRGMDLERLLACKKAGFPVVQYLSFIEKEIRRVDLKRMELSWLVYSDGFSFGLLDRVLKRMFDLTVSACMLALASPFLLMAMLAIRLDGAGPVLYRQTRITRDNKPFEMLKLRTMRPDAEASGAVWARQNDERVTRIGRFLRRSRMDELPQLINILKGEMSFVGPRPERPEFVAELARQIPLYNERHMVKAGLTGWAQINYPYGASVDDARSKLSYDLYYVKNFSILFDLIILLQTLRVVLWPTGVR